MSFMAGLMLGILGTALLWALCDADSSDDAWPEAQDDHLNQQVRKALHPEGEGW